MQSLASYSDRALHMREWANHFRGRPRNSITPLDIRRRLETLLASGYAKNTVNNRRTALMSFYTRMNGKSGYNPVRDVEKYPIEEEPRAQTIGTIYRILALMRPSKTRARLRVLLWSGWPHAQIMQLQPRHIDWKAGRAYVSPRRKGKGRQGAWLPLLPGAVVALQEFDRWDAYGEFSQSAMHSAFARALKKLNERRARWKKPALRIRPYDLRHTFGTMLAERLTDERAIQELMLHSTAKQTRRYTEQATAGRVRAAVATIAGKSPESRRMLPDRLPDRRNPQID